MAHTHALILVHCVFSTKGRKPMMPAAKLPELFAYFGGIARNKALTLIAVGGTEDHVHLLLRLATDESIAEAVRDLKANSSRWLRQTVPSFAWQEGYSAFSVSPSKKLAVMHYIEHQREHHRARGFDEELLELLQSAGVEYDQKYVLG